MYVCLYLCMFALFGALVDMCDNNNTRTTLRVINDKIMTKKTDAGEGPNKTNNKHPSITQYVTTYMSVTRLSKETTIARRRDARLPV